MPERRPYRREAVDKRREALITAALDLVAAGGSQAAWWATACYTFEQSNQLFGVPWCE